MSVLELLTADRRALAWLDRPGLAGWLAATGLLAGADFVSAERGLDFGLAFTVAESLFVLPWLLYVLRLSQRDLGRRNARRWPVPALLLVHGVNVLLLLLSLYQKFSCVLAPDPGTLHGLARYRVFTAAAYVLVSAGLLGRGSRIGRLVFTLSEHPSRLTALSFGLTGLLGALLLTLPVALRAPAEASFVDGLFTAISAVCVTGLVVHGTAETYTFFGQVVILLLFQVGGLGIMALYAAFAVFAGQRLRVRSTAVLAQMVDARSMAHLKRMVLSIVLFTFAFEAVGTGLLYALFSDYPAVHLGPESPMALAGAGGRLWAALFHAVSAFCNAGFSIFHAGAEPFAGDWGVSTVLMALIILGGLGFPVLRELAAHASDRLRRRRPPRMTLHTRTVLWTSALVTLIVAALLWVFEREATLAGRPVAEQLLTVLFQSVTARTAGFNTLPIAQMSAAGLMLLCLTMFIGASPASTGGGVKTTTAAVLFATFRAELGARKDPRLLDRTLTPVITRRAVSVVFLSTILVSAMLLLLLAIEPNRPLPLAFEVFSAFATVGLSADVTGHLTTAGKWVIMATMFIGRIGPLTLALALATPRSEHGLGLAREDLTIG